MCALRGRTGPPMHRFALHPVSSLALTAQRKDAAGGRLQAEHFFSASTPPSSLWPSSSRGCFSGITFIFRCDSGRGAQWGRGITARADHAAFVRIGRGKKKTPQAPTDVLSVSRDGFNVSQLNSYLNSVGLLRFALHNVIRRGSSDSENPCVQIWTGRREQVFLCRAWNAKLNYTIHWPYENSVLFL